MSDSIIGWGSSVGRWARIDNKSVIGEDVHVKVQRHCCLFRMKLFSDFQLHLDASHSLSASSLSHDEATILLSRELDHQQQAVIRNTAYECSMYACNH